MAPTGTIFLKAMGQARTYLISGDALRLLGAGQAQLARLETMYSHKVIRCQLSVSCQVID